MNEPVRKRDRSRTPYQPMISIRRNVLGIPHIIEPPVTVLWPKESAEHAKDAILDAKDLGPGEILVGIDLARGLGIFEGDKLTIIPPEALLLPPGEAPRFETVTVKGLISTNIQDIDAKVMFYARGSSLQSFRKSPSHEVGYELRFDNPDKAFAIGEELNRKGAKAANWAVAGFVFFSFGAYEICNYKRKVERNGVRMMHEVMEEKRQKHETVKKARRAEKRKEHETRKEIRRKKEEDLMNAGALI